jgi:hypothetical protein
MVFFVAATIANAIFPHKHSISVFLTLFEVSSVDALFGYDASFSVEPIIGEVSDILTIGPGKCTGASFSIFEVSNEMVLWCTLFTPALSDVILKVTIKLRCGGDISASAVGLAHIDITFVIVTIFDNISTEAHRYTILKIPVVNTTVKVVGPTVTMHLSTSPLSHIDEFTLIELEWSMKFALAWIALFS